MSAEWKEYRLSDLASKITKGTTPSKNDGGFSEQGINYIKAESVGHDGRIDTSKFAYITPEVHEKLKRSQLQENDILFSMAGVHLGKTAIVRKEHVPANTNQALALIRPIQNLVNPKYLHYYLQQREVVHFVNNSISQSAQPNINLNEIGNLEIRVPSLEVQNEIVDILSSIDEKIDINRQTNQTLEQIAQAIFKSWFVDFDPVRAKITAREAFIQQHPEVTEEAIRAAAGTEGDTLAHAGAKACELAAICAISGKDEEQLNELDADTLQQLKTTAALFPCELVESELGVVPEEWEVSTLGELIEFNPKRTLKKGVVAPYLDMKNAPTQGPQASDVYLREMGSGTKFINGDTLLARITPCLENGKTAFVNFLPKDQVGWGSTEYIVMRPIGERPTSLGYFIARLDSFRSKAIQTMTGTSGRQRANANSLADLDWIDYPVELLKRFDEISGTYLRIAKNNSDESRVLGEIRDQILPKLLSGEIVLSEHLSVKG